MEDKKDTIVDGKKTGDKTESGNPTHNADGTFGSGTGSGESSSVISDKLKSKFLDRIKMKSSSLFVGAREAYQKVKDKVITLKNFDFARNKNKEYRDLNYAMSDKNKQLLGNKIKDMFEKNELGMRIKFTNLIRAANQNKLKNLHEAGTGGGCTDSGYRGIFSESVFGSPKTTERVQRYDFEKYGCLVSRGVKDSIERRDGADHYGNCCLTFKKNNLKGRTTYTLDDSLSNRHVVPGIVGEDFDINCFVSTSTCERANYERNINNIVNSKTVRDFNNALDISYTELQYHGNLTFDDVSSIRVPDIYEKSEELKNLMNTIFKEKNIPVYTYDFVNEKEYKLEINEMGEITKTEVKL